jgi:hypothetical protein
LVFHHYNEIPEVITTKEKSIILAHGFFVVAFGWFCIVCFCVFEVLGFELRTLSLADGHSTTGATPPALVLFF